MTAFADLSRRSLSLALVMSIATAQVGCVTPLPAAPVAATLEAPGNLGAVTLVAASVDPQIRLAGFPRARGEASGKAAGHMFMSCMHGAVSCSGGGSLGASACGATILLLAGVCGVATGVGAVAVAASSDSAGAIESAEATITAALDVATIQEALRQQVAKAAASGPQTGIVTVEPDAAKAVTLTKDYRPLAARGVDTVVETALLEVGTTSEGRGSPLTVYMQAHMRLVTARGNTELVASNYTYLSERRWLKEWTADQGKLFRQALATGYSRLASQIYDDVFLAYPFPHRASQPSEFMGLEPSHPQSAHKTSRLDQDSSWSSIDSARPTFRWQAFPRDADLKAAPEAMARVGNVSYDLIIAEEEALAPRRIVFSGSGIPANRYRLEEPLRPRTRYFWTVRARFELDGRQHVTAWSSTASGTAWLVLHTLQGMPLPEATARWTLTQPNAAAYRFQTAAKLSADASTGPDDS